MLDAVATWLFRRFRRRYIGVVESLGVSVLDLTDRGEFDVRGKDQRVQLFRA